MKKFFLATVMFLVVALPQLKSQSDSSYLTKIWNVFEMGDYLGGTNIWCEDFNGDGSQELLFSGSLGYDKNYFTLFSYSNGTYSPSWTSPIYEPNRIRVLQTANLDEDNDYEIYVVTENGDIEVYNGATMQIENTYSTNAEHASQAVIADLDKDGDYEFIVVRDDYDEQYLQVYDMAAFTLQYETDNYGGTDVAVGDVDGDGENEIILSAGYVIDGTTFNVEWQYTGGFGDEIALANTDSDSIPEIISTNSTFIYAFDGALQTPLWQINAANYIDALTVTDVEDDGTDEILIGVDDWDVSIVCYSALTQQKLWENSDGENGVSNIGIGDPDNDGEKEFIFGSGIGSTAPDYLYIGNLDNYLTEWQSIALDGPFSTDVYDLDADDTLEIVGVSYLSDNDYNGSNVLTFNGITHNLQNIFDIGNWYGAHCMTTGNINETPQGEIVIGTGEYLYVYDGLTYQKLFQTTENIAAVYAIALGDIDNDNVVEIVVGDSYGYVTIFNGETFEQEWQSIQTGNKIGGIKLANCDDDDALEIVFFNEEGIVQMYDGVTHYLLWQGNTLDNTTAIDVKDYNQDGVMDIISGNTYGNITFTNCDNFTNDTTFQAFSSDITGLDIDNIDSTSQLEILAGASTLKVFSAGSFDLLWESDDIGGLVGRYNNIKVNDVNNNQYKDIVCATRWGIFQFEASTRYPDITPPKVLSVVPPDGFETTGTNIHLRVLFSETMDESSINDNTVSLTTNEGSPISKIIVYDTTENKITIIPDNNLPVESEINVLLSGLIADTSGNGLDGNGNGISEGSPDDDFIWSFTTGSGPDDVGPVFTELMADAYIKWAGNKIKINGTLSDSSSYASSPLEAAECFVDEQGADGTGIAMEAVDGHFDELIEDVKLTLSTDDWNEGDHILYFHGKDFIGNWGAFSSLSIQITTTQPGSWTMFGNNPQHSGYNSSDSITLPLKLKWTKSFAEDAINPACIVNDKVIVTTNSYFYDQGVYVLELETGSQEWADTSYYRVSSVNPPSFAYGNIYFQAYDEEGDSYLKSYDLISGDLLWQSEYESQWEKHFAPTIANGRVFINGGYYGGAYAYDAFNGQEYWFYGLPQYDEWTPAYYDNTIYAFTGFNSSDYGYLAAINAHTGMLLWSRDDLPFQWYGWSMQNAPVIDTASKIIFTTSMYYQSAVDLESHNILWNHEGKFFSPAVFDGVLYSVNNGKLYAYDVQTGNHLWSWTGTDDLSYPPVIANGYVFISSETDVYAISVEDHTQKWHYDTGGYLTVGENHLLIASPDGNLYAFEEMTTDVEENPVADNDRVLLYQNYPNPASVSDHTTIAFYLPEKTKINLVIYDIRGVKVAIIEDRFLQAGKHKSVVDLKNFRPGIYFYQLEAGNSFSGMKKLVVSN